MWAITTGGNAGKEIWVNRESMQVEGTADARWRKDGEQIYLLGNSMQVVWFGRTDGNVRQ